MLLTAGSGALVGLYAAVLVPISIAALRNHDPIHRGRYFDWVSILLLTLMPLGAIVPAVMSWLGRCPRLLSRLRWSGLALAIVLIIYLAWVGV